MMQIPLYGKSRQLLVDGLVEQFDYVNKTSEARWISLEAPSGWGKTRVIHEFYARLSLDRQDKKYWPPSILDSSSTEGMKINDMRKQTFPASKLFDREPGALPAYMWWGISALKKNGSEINSFKWDMEQLADHDDCLEAAWGQLANFRQKHMTVFNKSNARKAGAKVTEEAISDSIQEAIVTLAETSIPLLGLTTSLGKLGIKKYKRAKNRSEAVKTGGILKESTIYDDIIEETLIIIKRIAVPGLPIILFIEDFHNANPVLLEFITKLIRSNSSILVITTSWPGELNNIKKLQSLFGQKEINSRILRIRHDAETPDGFPAGASMSELSHDARASIVRFYYPRVNIDTLNLLLEKYTNPLALKIVCNLGIFKRKFPNGDLSLQAKDIDRLPSKVRGLYEELWDELPDSAKLAMAYSLHAIPKEQNDWHDQLVQSAFDKIIASDQNLNALLSGDIARTQGWVHITSEWLRCFNESIQYDIAVNYSEEELRDSDISRFMELVAEEATKEPFDTFSPENINRAYLVISLNEQGLIGNRHALNAACFLMGSLIEQPRALHEVISLGKYAKALFNGLDDIQPEDNTKLYVHNILAYAYFNTGQLQQALELFEDLLKHLIRILGEDHPEVLITRQNRATAILETGDKKRALELLEDLLKHQIRVLGEDHPEVLRTRNNSATAILKTGDKKRALELLEDLLKHQIRVLGKYDLNVFKTRKDIAIIIAKTKDFDNATLLLKELLKDQTRILGENHPEVKDTMDKLKQIIVFASFDPTPHKKKSKVGRNDPCHCGSGKKYKKCCLH